MTVATGVNPLMGGLGSNYFTQAYNGLVGLDDALGNVGLDSSLFTLGSNPMGMYGGMMGYNSKTWQMYNNMDPIEQMRYQMDLQKQQLDLQTEYKKKYAGEEFKEKAADTAVTRQFGALQRSIADQGDVMTEYNKAIAAYKRKLTEEGAIDANTPEDQVKAQSEEAYFNATGVSLTDDIKRHGNNEFVQGLLEGTFGLGFLVNNGKSAKDNISTITGEQRTQGDDFARWTGRILAGLGTLVALPFLLRGGKTAGSLAKTQTLKSWGSLFKK